MRKVLLRSLINASLNSLIEENECFEVVDELEELEAPIEEKEVNNTWEDL
jgi:hypothetical protein